MIETVQDKTLKYRYFPGFSQNQSKSAVDSHLENIDKLGYSIMEDALSASQCQEIQLLLKNLYVKQEKEFGLQRLKTLNESEIHRGLLVEDEIFVRLAADPKVLEVVKQILGSSAILNLQNASRARPDTVHYQSAWHRDFAKDFVPSKCLSVNAFWCITPFSKDNGATWLLPFSHKYEEFPSEQYIQANGIQIEAKAGSVIFWDSLLLHKAGLNHTKEDRFGINHMYTRPFIKQQIDFPVYLSEKVELESELGQLFGFWSIPPKSVTEFRCDPEKRTYRAGQG